MTKSERQVEGGQEPSRQNRFDIKKIAANLCTGPYILIPISATIVWFFGLVILLGMWIGDGKPRYRETQASIPYISSVGAAYETFFFILCLSVIIFYFSSEKIYSWLAIFFCGIGCLGLFVLSKWNCWDYKTIHWSGTFVYIIGIAFSSIFQTAEVWCLRKEHPDRRHLKRNGIFKMIVVALAVILSGTFGGFYSYCGGKPFTDDDSHTPDQCEIATNISAILEWSIAFSLNLYFITLVIDLWPSRRTSRRYVSAEHDESSSSEKGNQNAI
ncbi:uncharacterized protein I206_107389 [Kwoniella pini CBS 10737]|uniref:CWH43-like N-terminal domain-containing protein n=1 Tax=Kwoniella pini CBS 10737 TaxID=1296096 RepID=A0A1B9HX57_9TREE|nr:uncharacterized protein I206_05715 [Kwoniella pini CBS 10737]OCF47855.1 hypothetical protein I206_05715 [Kwoniella pini CBS 10737]